MAKDAPVIVERTPVEPSSLSSIVFYSVIQKLVEWNACIFSMHKST